MHCWIVWNKIKNEQYPPPLPFFPFSYTVKWTIHGSGPLPLSLNKITQPLFSGPVSKNYDGNYVDSKFSKGKHSKRKKTQFRQDNAKKKRTKERAADCLIFANIWGTYIWVALTYWTRDLSTVTIDVLKHVILAVLGPPGFFHNTFMLISHCSTEQWQAMAFSECFSCKAWLEVIFSIAASSSSWREQTWDAF